MENTSEFPITLGRAKIRSIPGQSNKKDYTVSLLTSAGQQVGVFMSAHKYPDGAFHRFRIGIEASSRTAPAPDLPPGPMFQTDQECSRGLWWEWASDLLGKGEIPISRPGHPHDTTVDIMVQEFKQFTDSLWGIDGNLVKPHAWSVPFALSRLLRAGWPISETARVVFEDTINQIDRRNELLHEIPRKIFHYGSQKRAVLQNGEEVPLQNYYLLDKHYTDLIDSGSAVPDYLRQKVLTTPFRPRKPK